MMTADKIISVMEVLLAQLTQTLEQAPVNEGDDRSKFLKADIAAYKQKVGRLNKVLKAHKDAEARKKFLDRQNKRNNSKE